MNDSLRVDYGAFTLFFPVYIVKDGQKKQFVCGTASAGRPGAPPVRYVNLLSGADLASRFVSQFGMSGCQLVKVQDLEELRSSLRQAKSEGFQYVGIDVVASIAGRVAPIDAFL